jgi:hypothetical protein
MAVWALFGRVAQARIQLSENSVSDGSCGVFAF